MNRADQERLVALQKEQERRNADDPLRSFELSPKQAPFVDAVLKKMARFIGFFGANRSGKSAVGSFTGSTLARFGFAEDPKSLPHAGASIQVRDRATSGWVVSLDTNISRDVIEPKYFDNGFVAPGAPAPFIPKREILEWRHNDGILKLKNGSIIGFKSVESGQTKAQGAGKDWIHFDEEPPKSYFDECAIRVEAGRSLSVFMTCTLLPPVGQVGGVTWVFPEIIKPWQEKRSKTWMLFGASIYDNPHLGKDEIAALESIYPEGSAARRIRLDGEWLPGIGGTRAYAAFNARIHVRPNLPLVDRIPLCFIWDFNISPLISLVGQRQGNLFRVLAELAMEEGNIPDMCQMFYERFGGHRGEIWIYGDATGQGRTPQFAKSDYGIIMSELKRYGLPLRLKVRAKNPLVNDRLAAMNRVLKNENGGSDMEIDESCTELVADLEQVLMDSHGGIKKSHNNKDPYFRRTHASDSLGYWIAYESPVRLYGAKSSDNVVQIRDVSYSRRA